MKISKCPGCGEKARVVWHFDSVWIQCGASRTEPCIIGRVRKSREAALRAWNRRAAMLVAAKRRRAIHGLARSTAKNGGARG